MYNYKRLRRQIVLLSLPYLDFSSIFVLVAGPYNVIQSNLAITRYSEVRVIARRVIARYDNVVRYC